ncbi:MAG: tripartite tricarboxylate transporter substrate binding protein [Alphaproteobacteria bacterium]|nr:tripartite tricarboxylate transporter substrate binding protein [Alphaproteobacteria bacterium]
MKNSPSRRQILALGAAAGWASIHPVMAQGVYPNKPIRMIIPLAAGSAVDVAARLLAQKMSATLGQSIVIENITGAAGLIGADRLTKAAPDGYTIGGFNDSILTMVPNINPNTPFNPLTDFTYITLAAAIEFSAAVSVGSRFKTIGELVAAAQAAPDTITYASGGIGSPQHIAGAMFSSHTGVKLKHVPYKGASQAAQGAAAAEADVTFQGIATVSALVKAGKLRLLGVPMKKRHPQFPDIPTFEESGVKGFEFETWFALTAPPGVPKDIIDRLHKAALQGLADTEIKERFDGLGLVPVGNTPEQFLAKTKDQHARYGKVIKEQNIKPE